MVILIMSLGGMAAIVAFLCMCIVTSNHDLPTPPVIHTEYDWYICEDDKTGSCMRGKRCCYKCPDAEDGSCNWVCGFVDSKCEDRRGVRKYDE